MPLAVTSAPSDELLSAEEAKRHLRIFSSDLDDEIQSLIRAARDYCERFTARTLRATVTRTYKTDEWWDKELQLPYPPLLGITSITYFDADNASQTLSATSYVVENNTDGGGRIVWKDGVTLPTTYTRSDAITVTFTTGYASLDAVPPVAVQAIKTKLTELWGSGTENEIEAARKCTDRLLSLVDWTGYA